MPKVMLITWIIVIFKDPQLCIFHIKECTELGSSTIVKQMK
uniref:Uncharacterized protein n=1 Tax=Arundo donax TaxID=35708 RepID=A0A0A9CRM6_ARUDO